MKQDLQIRKPFRVLATLLLLLLLPGLPGKAWAQSKADGTRDNPYQIDLTSPAAITDVTTVDEVTVGSNKYKRITLLTGGASADARVYYKLTDAANIADKVILWNYLKDTKSTTTNITLLVNGNDVSLYGMHLGGDVSLEAANSGEDKLTISGSSTYLEPPYGDANGYALSFMDGYHFRVGEGLQVEVTSLLPRNDNKFQPFPDEVEGAFTINGTLMGGTSFYDNAAPTNSIANTNITIDPTATATAILQIDVPNGVQSESLILKKKEGDTFTDYLTLPTKIAANPTRSISIYSICVPAGTYQCWDGDAMLEQFNEDNKGSIKTSFEANAKAVTAHGLLCLPFDLSTIREATTFKTWVTTQSGVVYWGAVVTAGDNDNAKARTVFSRLTQSTENVKYPVTFTNNSGSTRYLLCSSNINIKVSGEDPALTFGADITVKFIQGNDATKPLEKPTITLANDDNKKRALLVDGYSFLYGSLIVNGSVRLEDGFDLHGSLEINTPEGTPNITKNEQCPRNIWLYPVDDKERYVSLSDYRDDDGNVTGHTVSLSPAENIRELTFSYITFKTQDTSWEAATAKVQPGLKLAIEPKSSSYQAIVSKHTSNGFVENSPLIPVDGAYSYQIMEEDAEFEELVIYAKNLSPYEISGVQVPITLTCDKYGIWKYTTNSSSGTYTDLFNGTLALGKGIGKDAGTQSIEVIVAGTEVRTLTLDAVALQPTSGEYAIKVSEGNLKISPDYNASTIIPPVKDGVYQPALLVAAGASCEVTYTNSGNILFYGEAKAGETGVIKGLVQLQWTDPIDKDVQITKKGETKLVATFPALPDASPKPSIVAWNPNTYGTNWKTEYIVKKDGKQQVGKNSENKEVTSFAYSSSTGNLTAFTELRDISADEMVGAANVGPSGTDVTITNKEYLVKTPLGLAWIAAVTNKKLTEGDAAAPSGNGFDGCTVRISGWIDLSKLEFDWVPIGNSAETPFKGTLNGAVKNSTYKIMNLPGSLIGKTGGAKILNMCVHLTGEGGEITGSSWGGLVATATNTTIENCYVSTTSAISPGQAPIVLSGSSLATVGGMVGTLDGTSTLKNCYSTLCLSIPTGNVTLGGIAGKSDGTLCNCFCLGSLSAPAGIVGGIVGDGSVEYGLALSPSITGATAYRVASTTGKNNYASSKTLLNGAAVTSDVATSADGATVYMHDFKDKLVEAWGDRQYDYQIKGYTNYPWTFDVYNNFTPLLCIKADDGTYADGSDNPYKFSDYLIYVLVTIDTEVTYDANLHKSRDLVIKPTGVLDCPSGASVHDVTIESGGQITGEEGSLLYPNKLIIPREIKHQWTTFYSPSDALEASALSFTLYRNTGYTDADEDQRWTEDDVAADSEITIEQSSPYLLSVETPQTVTFTVDKPWVTLDNALGTDGPDINTGIFLFKGNPRLHNVEMKNIYALSADGSRFDLQTTYTLKPFECYIVANEQTQSLVRSLSLKDMPTGIDQPLTATFRIWSSAGQLCLSTERDTEVTIVNVAGQVVYHQRVPAGEQRITLPSGIYFVRGGNITYKVKL